MDLSSSVHDQARRSLDRARPIGIQLECRIDSRRAECRQLPDFAAAGALAAPAEALPFYAARRPWFAVKIRVQLVLIPSSANRDIASSPSSLIGTLTTMFGAIFAKARPSLSIPSTSSATTSAETGPEVIVQISLRTSS